MPTPDPTADFRTFTDDMYKLWEQSMTSWWDQVLDSPEFLGASGKGLSAMADARREYEHKVDETLVQMHLPTRGDVTRLARISTLLEERILKMEDTVLEVKDLVEEAAEARDTRTARLEKEVVEARIEAAEARLELKQALAAMEQRLAALQAQLAAAPPAKAPARRSSRGRKPAPTDSQA